MSNRPVLKRAILALLAVVIFAAVSPADAIDDYAKDFKKSIKDASPDKARAAVNQISRSNNAKAVKTMLDLAADAAKASDEYYWIALNGLANIEGQEAFTELLTFLTKNAKKATAIDAVFILKSNVNEAKLPLVESILKDCPDDMRSLAVDYISEVPSKKIFPIFVTALKNLPAESTLIKERIFKILKVKTGQDNGTNADAWAKWWQDNQNKTYEELLVPSQPAMGGGWQGAGGKTAKDYVGDDKKTDVESLSSTSGSIVVIRSTCNHNGAEVDHSFDHIEEMLATMGIPHEVITKKQFEEPSYSLNNKIAVLVNCNMFREHCTCPTCKPGGDPAMRLFTCTGCDVHNNTKNMMSDKGVEKIQKYVADGGYLFTEDWVIEEIIERAFPEYIGHSGYLEEMVAKITPQPGATANPLLKGVFERPAKAADGGGMKTSVEKPQLKVGEGSWKIDKDSPNLIVKRPDVKVLMVSPDLAKKDPKADAVAVTFNYAGKGKVASGGGGGGGVVVHVLSHFGKQKSESDEFALQFLLLNFVTEAKLAYDRRGKK